MLGRFLNTGLWGRGKERIKILFYLRIFGFKSVCIYIYPYIPKLKEEFVVLTVRYALLYKIIVCILFVLELYLTLLIKISSHVIIRNRCFNNPSAIDFSLYVNHFSV